MTTIQSRTYRGAAIRASMFFLGTFLLSVFLDDGIALGKEGALTAKPVHEPIEWTDMWVMNAHQDNLPRVLLVGDSIVKGYYRQVEKEMAGKANCARYTTSAFLGHQDYLDGLKIFLDRYSFEVIHINNGLHGWDYTEQQYRDSFPALTTLLKKHAPNAKIIWAMTTPLRVRDNIKEPRKESTERVRNRNAIAAKVAKANNWGTSDLFGLTLDHVDYFKGDGTHFSPKGIAVQAAFVTEVVSEALGEKSNRDKKSVHYTTNFESGAGDWNSLDPKNWKVKEERGKHVLSLFNKKSDYKPKFRSPTHVNLLKGHSVGDFQVDARVLSTHPDYHHLDVCFFFGVQSPTQFYYAHLGKRTDPHANQIFIVNGSDRTKISLTTTSGTPWDDKWHNVRITRNVKSGEIKVFFDNMKTPAMTAKDSTFTRGRVGVGSFDDTADFDTFTLTGTAAAAPTAAPTTKDTENTNLPATVRPVSKEVKRWIDRHRKMNKRVKQGDVDLVFIGDSINQGWEKQGRRVWAQYYGMRKAVNLGVSGDRTQHVLWRLQNGNLDGISPKLAVIMIGTNNSGDDSPEDIAAGVKAILDEVQKRCPTTKILLLDIFPRGVDDANGRRKVNAQANKIMTKFADSKKIYYLNIGDNFLDKNRVLSRKIMPDLLHPNERGYRVWAEAIEPSVQKLMGEKEDINAIIRKKNGFRELTNIDPSLPNALVVGDSICSGYNDEVRELLAGKANVYAWITGMNLRRGNIEETQRAALAAVDFDVVHFNIGLHGLGDRIPDELYEPLLRKYVANFKKHGRGAHLIWGSTTPIWDAKTNVLKPGNAKIVKRNAIAAKVMKENNIPVTQLYDAVVDKLELGGGIHWSDAGSMIMAQAISENIEAALQKPRQKTSAPEANSTVKLSDPTDSAAEQAKLPATVRPVSRTGGWMNRHQAMNKRVKKGNVDLIFVGDSITHFWDRKDKGLPVWENFYGQRNAVNLGTSGDRTQHVLWRLQNGNLEGISPKAAVVMIGTNNASHNTPEDIAAGVEAIVNTIEEKCPSTHILILGIFPRGKDDADKRRIVTMKTNKIIAKLADDRTIFYMDIGDAMLEDDRTLSREIMPDRLHPNAKGYQIWAEAIEKKLVELMEEEEAALSVPQNASVDELFKFIDDTWRTQPKIITRESFKHHTLKVFPVIVEATDAILATSDDLEVQIRAIEKKLKAYRILAMYDKGASGKGEALAKQLSSDKRDAIANVAVSYLLSEASIHLRKASKDEAELLVNNVKAYLKRFGVDRATYQVAYQIGRRYEGSPHVDKGIELYEFFIPLLRDSGDIQLASRISSLEGAVRRLQLLGNSMKVFGATGDGKEFDWESYRGKVVLVDFWASWCGPCLGEIPGMKKNLEKYGDKGFVIVGVNMDSDREDFENCVSSQGITWVNLFSKEKGKRGWDSPLARHYGISGIPTAILIDQQGKVVSLRARGPDLDKQLAALLGDEE